MVLMDSFVIPFVAFNTGILLMLAHLQFKSAIQYHGRFDEANETFLCGSPARGLLDLENILAK